MSHRRKIISGVGGFFLVAAIFVLDIPKNAISQTLDSLVVSTSTETTFTPGPLSASTTAQQATTSQATTTVSISTTTGDFAIIASSSVDFDEDKQKAKNADLPENTEIIDETAEDESESTEGGWQSMENQVETIIPALEEFSPSKPSLSVRKINKEIRVSRRAKHSCTAEQFSVNISGRGIVRGKLLLTTDPDRDEGLRYEVEIGDLPFGIDILFSDNFGYVHDHTSGNGAIDFEIRNHNGSQKGNFSVPIVYTKKGGNISSVICQLNIVNVE